MSVDLANIASDIATANVQVGPHTFDVTYRPNVITGDFVDRSSQGQGIDDFLKSVTELVVDWDILNNGEKVPIEVHAMRGIPISFLQKLIESLIETTQGSGEA